MKAVINWKGNPLKFPACCTLSCPCSMMATQSCLICGVGEEQLEESSLQDIFSTPAGHDGQGSSSECSVRQKLEYVLDAELHQESCPAPYLCTGCEVELEQIWRYCSMITKFRNNYLKTMQDFISSTDNGTQSPQTQQSSQVNRNLGLISLLFFFPRIKY